jgi:hypothetical protein
VRSLATMLIMLMLIPLLLSFSVGAETSYVFERMEFDVGGRRILVLWERLGVPDVIVRYCGVNYVYFDAVTKWWDQILVEWGVSRYVGLRVTNNSERIATYNELREAFEKTGVRELGWYGMLDLFYYFDWEPRILGIHTYLGGVEAPREAKINRIKALLSRVSSVLEEYNVSIVMVVEVHSMVEIKRSSPAAHALVRVLNEARTNKSGIPDVVRKYVVEGGWSAGNSLGLVGLAFGLPAPSKEDLEVLVKWIRDRMGYCEIPLAIAFNVPMPDGVLAPQIATLKPDNEQQELQHLEGLPALTIATLLFIAIGLLAMLLAIRKIV